MMILTYVHDPMCSWCYGFRETLGQLIEGLPDNIEIRRLLGGLAADCDEAMPEAMQRQIRSNWQRIEQSIPGVTFNYDFWTRCQPRRSTYPSCRAVIAAREQGQTFDERMTHAIQRAYYQQARNPSDVSTLIELADELSLDTDAFTRSIMSEQTQQILLDEIQQSRELGAESFPALKLQIDDAVWPIAINYNDSNEMLELIDMLSQPS